MKSYHHDFDDDDDDDDASSSPSSARDAMGGAVDDATESEDRGDRDLRRPTAANAAREREGGDPRRR